MLITIVAGARPNFMKISPIIRKMDEFKKMGCSIEYRLVHTGQHFDDKMSSAFFHELGIPEPHVNLMAGGGSQAEQTGAIMVAFEKELIENPTDLVIVVGDVTSTMACSIVAKKQNTLLAHVEAGIRSFDDTMPEEINRKVTDCLADYFFITSIQAGENLEKCGVNNDRIYFVGNVMIDTLHYNLKRLVKPALFDSMSLTDKNYMVLTLHRPNNVDDPIKLNEILQSINDNSLGLPVIFPVHPRTRKIIEKIGIHYNNIHFTEPMGYLEFMYLVKNSMAVITDSGGITEETTVLHIPCMTIRDNTERPETCTVGTNELIGTNPSAIKPALEKLFSGQWKYGNIPEKWDGNAADRIVKQIIAIFDIK